MPATILAASIAKPPQEPLPGIQPSHIVCGEIRIKHSRSPQKLLSIPGKPELEKSSPSHPPAETLLEGSKPPRLLVENLGE